MLESEINQGQGGVMKWSHRYRPDVDYFPTAACPEVFSDPHVKQSFANNDHFD